MLAGIMCLVVTVVIFVLGKLESPVRLGLLVVNCANMDAADDVLKTVKENSSYCRIKNKTVSREMTEVIIEFKSKKEKQLEKCLMDNSNVKKFSFISYDREDRI